MPPPIPIHYDIRTVARTIWPLFMPIIVTNFIISTIGYHMGVKIVNEHNNLFFILFFLIFYITPLWLLFVTLCMLGFNKTFFSKRVVHYIWSSSYGISLLIIMNYNRDYTFYNFIFWSKSKNVLRRDLSDKAGLSVLLLLIPIYRFI